MNLIGLTGAKGVGKSTVAARLVELGFVRHAFAGPLKAMLTAGFGFSFEDLTGEEKEKPIPGLGVTPRHLMQTLGTEWGRAIDRDLWLKLMRRKLEAAGPTALLVIDDVRFDNEAALIKSFGGSVFEVTRRGFRPARDGHASERGVSHCFIDARIDTGRCVPHTASFNGRVLSAILAFLR